MSCIDTNNIQNLMEQIEALKKTLELADEKGKKKLGKIDLDGMLKEIPLTTDGKLDVIKWGGLGEGGQRKQHSKLICVFDDLKEAAGFGAPKPPTGYSAALIAMLIFLPSAATVFTLMFLLFSSDQSILYGFSPLWGTLVAFGVWLFVLSPLCCLIADAKHAIPSSYGELLPRLDELEAGLKGFCPGTGSSKNPCRNTAYFEAVKENDEIRRDLSRKGLAWLMATGYSNVWGRVYRAEEAMIEVEPQSKVLVGSYYDESRLEGSDIQNRDDLLAKLRKAVVSIDPCAHKYLKSTASVTAPPALSIGTTALPGGTVAAGYCATLLAIGGVPPYKWAFIEGAIPDGLTLSASGVLRGTPIIDGHANFTVQVTDSTGVAAGKYFDLLISPQTQATPPPLAFSTTPPLPLGTVDAEYAERLFATGGKPPYKWKEITIADGIHLSNEGILSGRPAKDNTFKFTVEVADSTSTNPIQREFTLLIKPSGSAADVPVGGAGPEQLARGVLRHVRSSLNGYRNARWNGLILARNRLLATFMLTGMIVFALLAIAIMSGAARSTIIAATVFYLVGATVGLSNRLRSESQAESAMPDYGLSVARLITIPLFSGLGAIGGLLFMAYLPLSTPIFSPSHSTPLAVSTDSTLKKYTLNKPYETTLVATGGTQPYKWMVTEATKAAIPGGLQLSPVGVLSGTPSKPGQSDHFVVEVTDNAASKLSKEFILPLESSIHPEEKDTGTAKQAIDTAEKAAPKVAAGDTAEKVAPKVAAGDTAEKAAPQTPKAAETTLKEASSKALAQPGDGNITNEKAPQLEDIFNLKKNLIGLFVAAVFGLAPGMLFDRLQQQADRYKTDLKISQSTGGTQKP
jgi:hypothetical protein